MKIKNICMQFNVEIELSDGVYTTAQRDNAGNWWCTDDWRSDFKPAEIKQLEQQFRVMMESGEWKI